MSFTEAKNLIELWIYGKREFDALTLDACRFLKACKFGPAKKKEKT